MRSFVVVGLLAVPVVAGADDASPFVTMFHQDGGTKVDIDAAYMFANSDAPTTVTKLYRGDLFAEYVDPSNGLGGYVTIPFIHSTDAMTTKDSLGGLEVGGVLVRKLDAGTIVGHAGLVLPTISSQDSSVIGLSGSVMRIPEVYATLPDAVSLRIGVSPLFHTGSVIVRLDVNVDLNVSETNETEKPGFEVDAGIGYSSGLVAIMAEITNVVIIGDYAGLTLDVGAISARFDLGKLKPYVAVSIPLDDDARQIMSAGVTVGLSATP